MILVPVILFYLLITTNFSLAATSPFSIVPTPQSIKTTPGVFTFKANMGICIKGAMKTNNQTAGFEFASSISNAFKMQLKVQPESRPAQLLDINLFQDGYLFNDSTLRSIRNKDEFYTISVYAHEDHREICNPTRYHAWRDEPDPADRAIG